MEDEAPVTEEHAPYVDLAWGPIVEYSCRIAIEFFGPLPADICRALLKSGPLPLREVSAATGHSHQQCRHALLSLIQHSFVQPFLREEIASARSLNTATVYQADPWRIVLSVRQPTFLMHIGDTLGADAETLCTILVHNGRLTLHQVTQAFTSAGSNGDVDTSLSRACADTMASLLNACIIEQVPPCDLPLTDTADKRAARPRAARVKLSQDQRMLDAAHALTLEQYQKRRYELPTELHGAISGAAPLRRSAHGAGAAMDVDGGAHRSDASNDEHASAEEALLRLNFDALCVHMRHQHCTEFIASTQGATCSQAAQAMLDLSLSTDLQQMAKPEDERFHCALKLDAIAQRSAQLAAEQAAAEEHAAGAANGAVGGDGAATATAGASFDAEACTNALSILEDATHVERTADGAYVFHQASTMEVVQQVVLASYIKRRFGVAGHRVWRLGAAYPYLQLDAVAKQAMLDTRGARQHVYALFQAGHLQVQEVPKSSERAPSRAFYLYHTDTNASICQLIADTALAAGNLLARSTHERQAKRHVLELAQRRMAGEAGLKMTAGQVADAVRVKHAAAALNASLLRLDGMLAKFDSVIRP